MFGSKEEENKEVGKLQDNAPKMPENKTHWANNKIQPDVEREMVNKTKSLVEYCLNNAKFHDKDFSSFGTEGAIYRYVEWMIKQLGKDPAYNVIPKQKD